MDETSARQAATIEARPPTVTVPVRAGTNQRGSGPESSGDFWRVYPHKDGGHELAVWVAKGVRRKIRIPKKYVTREERARFAKGAAAELKRQHREEEKPLAASRTPDSARLTFGDVADLWTSGDSRVATLITSR